MPSDEKNDKSFADPESESGKHEYRHGVFVPGNKVTQAKDLLHESAQGSWGLGLDQAEYRVSHRQDTAELSRMGQNVERISRDMQGSQMHLGKHYPHREQEDRF